MASHPNLRFAANNPQFFATVNQRVNNYFKTNNISKHANGHMVIKTIFMLSLYFTPYALLLGGVIQGSLAMWFASIVMGLGMAGIGLSIMHDANHGAYSSKQWVNDLMGMTLNLVGGHAFNWKVQHNVLHHTYTNVHEVDEDISPRGVLRMAPGSPWKPMHKYQHLYAWFFYGLLTFVWILFKDFHRLTKYQAEGMVARQKTTAMKQWTALLITKVIYLFYIAFIPMYILDLSFGTWFIGFLTMHYTSGFILAIIFQPAHVIDGTVYPEPDDNGNLENNWAIHQMQTTTNFAMDSTWFSWYVGGLNFQVEHHMFPQICHIHYRKIAPILEATAKEFGVPYKKKKTFLDAIIDHAKMMKVLGASEKVQFEPLRA
ncbi:MAG: fatty acid desaturase family protein [Cyclobacteriaceae bacterium]